MPTIAENRQIWSSHYRWPAGGDEWSVRWGGADAQWFGAIYPRIHAFLPAATILEIAPGYGRWTTYLKDHGKRLVLVDLNQNCIDRCQARFAGAAHLEYHVNDGKSLAMIGDDSLDFVFSFDSLVHAEADVIQAYLTQLARKLAPNGVGFIHHSNLGAHRVRQWVMQQILPTRLRQRLVRRGLLPPDGLRATSMTAQLFAVYAAQAGLCCVSQEVINWHGSLFSDCFSVFTRPASVWARQNRVYRNRAFARETAHIRQLSTLYTRASFRDAG